MNEWFARLPTTVPEMKEQTRNHDRCILGSETGMTNVLPRNLLRLCPMHGHACIVRPVIASGDKIMECVSHLDTGPPLIPVLRLKGSPCLNINYCYYYYYYFPVQGEMFEDQIQKASNAQDLVLEFL